MLSYKTIFKIASKETIVVLCQILRYLKFRLTIVDELRIQVHCATYNMLFLGQPITLIYQAMDALWGIIDIMNR